VGREDVGDLVESLRLLVAFGLDEIFEEVFHSPVVGHEQIDSVHSVSLGLIGSIPDEGRARTLK
jgi:hypothetical protein